MLRVSMGIKLMLYFDRLSYLLENISYSLTEITGKIKTELNENIELIK